MDTPTFTSTDIVSFAGQKDAVNLKTAFDQLVGQKVVDAIQARKVEIASSMFAEPEAEEQETVDTAAQAGEEQAEDKAGDTETAQAQETEESDEDTEVTS